MNTKSAAYLILSCTFLFLCKAGIADEPRLEWAFETKGKIYASPIPAVLDGDGNAVDFRILDINPTCETYLAVERDKAVGRYLSELEIALPEELLELLRAVAARGDHLAEGLFEAVAGQRGDTILERPLSGNDHSGGATDYLRVIGDDWLTTDFGQGFLYRAEIASAGVDDCDRGAHGGLGVRRSKFPWLKGWRRRGARQQE